MIWKDKLLWGDCKEIVATLPDNCVDCVVTSPPYWNLRDYEVEGQLGLEDSYLDYITKLCDLFDEIKRVLKPEGSVFVDIGDTYYGSTKVKTNKATKLSPRTLTMIPARFGIEMLNRGWIIPNKIIWHKPNIMPRPCKKRFIVNYEEIFFFVKQENYYFQTQYEPFATPNLGDLKVSVGDKYKDENVKVENKSIQKFYNKVKDGEVEGRIMRSVWKIAVSNQDCFHKAPYPEQLIVPILNAVCPPNGIVLDPFMGTGTTAIVALKQDKHFIGIDLDNRAIEYAQNRINSYLEQTTIFSHI